MTNKKQCPACGVIIENNEKVLFSFGKPGSKSRLKARCCRYIKDPIKKAQCINDFEGEWSRQDEYD